MTEEREKGRNGREAEVKKKGRERGKKEEGGRGKKEKKGIYKKGREVRGMEQSEKRYSRGEE